MNVGVEIHQSQTSQAGALMSNPVAVGAQGSTIPEWAGGEPDPPSRAAHAGEGVEEVRLSAAFPESTNPETSHTLVGCS